MAVGVGDAHHHPLTVPILESVLHRHCVVYCGVTLGMKGDGSRREIFVECHGRGGYIKAFEIETRTSLEALDDRFLHLLFGFEPIAATGKQCDRKQKSRWDSQHDPSITDESWSQTIRVSARTLSRAPGSCDPTSRHGQVFVRESHNHRSLAYRRGDAVHCARPEVASSEYTRYAGLK